MLGWELSSLDDGGDSGFWRLPGYGDFLEQRVRDRQADVGAPEGFEDAVAWLVPMTVDGAAGRFRVGNILVRPKNVAVGVVDADRTGVHSGGAGHGRWRSRCPSTS